MTIREKGLSPIRAACQVFTLTKEQIRSRAYPANFVDARMCVAWAHDLIGFSITEIGETLDKSDATVKNYLEYLEMKLKSDEEFCKRFELFKAKLKYF